MWRFRSRPTCPSSSSRRNAILEARRRALTAGAHDFLTKPFERFEALLRIKNLLETRRLHLALEAHNRSLEDTVCERTERLMQSEQVAAMGALLAGVVHELNNPLTVLSGQSQLLLRDSDPTLARRAAQIQRAADRCVRIVRNFPALRRRIAFLTGDVLSRDKRAFLDTTGAPGLTKPCDLDEVRRALHGGADQRS